MERSPGIDRDAWDDVIGAYIVAVEEVGDEQASLLRHQSVQSPFPPPSTQ